jgi:hypothetical protein
MSDRVDLELDADRSRCRGRQLAVAGDARSTLVCRVPPDGVFAALAQRFAAVTA